MGVEVGFKGSGYESWMYVELGIINWSLVIKALCIALAKAYSISGDVGKAQVFHTWLRMQHCTVEGTCLPYLSAHHTPFVCLSEQSSNPKNGSRRNHGRIMVASRTRTRQFSSSTEAMWYRARRKRAIEQGRHVQGLRGRERQREREREQTTIRLISSHRRSHTTPAVATEAQGALPTHNPEL